MLRARLSRCATALPRVSGVRSLHQLPPIPSAIAEGCEPFLSKRTTHLLWTQWQAGLLQRLNEEAKGMWSHLWVVLPIQVHCLRQSRLWRP